VDFEAGHCIVFEIELCGCSGSSGRTVHLSFPDVKNIDEVRSFIEPILGRAKEQGRIAEIIGLLRDDDRRFLMDLDHGALYIKAKSFIET